jgi:hypothetical protein
MQDKVRLPTGVTQTMQREITFIRKDGPMMIRMVDTMLGTIVDAANSLGANYVVMATDWHVVEQCPIWEVFDMRKVRKNTPTPGEKSLPPAEKQFVAATNDGAVMWAVTRGSK